MKKICVTLLALIPLVMNATKIKVGAIWYEVLENTNNVEVCLGDNEGYKNLGDIELPSKIESKGFEYNVTSIGEGVFGSESGLTSIIFPQSVITIKQRAFSGCKSLKTVKMSDSVNSIGKNAFWNCENLSSINLSSKITIIEEGLFSGCHSLSNIILPEGLIEIKSFAFSGCTSLLSIMIPSKVNSLKPAFLAGCNNLKEIKVDPNNNTYDSRDNCNGIIHSSSDVLVAGCKSTVIPNTVIEIGEEAFRGNEGLVSIEIPGSVRKIGQHAFALCKGLDEIFIPDGVTEMDDGAFTSSGIKFLFIGKGLSIINGYTFSFCANLISVVVPNNVAIIRDGAFQNCENLTSLVLGSNVGEIGDGIFYDCPMMKDFYVYSETIPKAQRFDSSYRLYDYVTLHVPSQLIDSYKSESPWANFKNIVSLKEGDPDTTSSIEGLRYNMLDSKFIDLNGRIVEKPSRGIYIYKGRKTIIR